jgi:hypothetical protein
VPDRDQDELWELRWTEAQARGFMLLDVLVHELGHHHDRLTAHAMAARRAPRGEPYEMAYAKRRTPTRCVRP